MFGSSKNICYRKPLKDAYFLFVYVYVYVYKPAEEADVQGRIKEFEGPGKKKILRPAFEPYPDRDPG